MSILKTVGGVANGWAKFLVTLLAVGWFGVYALDQVGNGSRGSTAGESSVSRYDEDIATPPTREEAPGIATEEAVASDTEEAGTSDIEHTQATSALGQMSGEVWTGLSTMFGSTIAQLVLSFLAGTGIGLAGRPALSRAMQRRRVLAARRRQAQYDQDRQLLAGTQSAPTGSQQGQLIPPTSPSGEPMSTPRV